jgi:hypothetical protein
MIYTYTRATQRRGIAPDGGILSHTLRGPLKRMGLDVDSVVRVLFSEPIFLGYPTKKSIAGCYWRKRMPVPAEPDPEPEPPKTPCAPETVPRMAPRHAEVRLSPGAYQPREQNTSMADRATTLRILVMQHLGVRVEDGRDNFALDRARFKEQSLLDLAAAIDLQFGVYLELQTFRTGDDRQEADRNRAGRAQRLKQSMG